MHLRRAFGTAAVAVTALLGGACDDITGANDATIVVENNASVAVWYLYISDCDDDSWGNDELGSGTIPPGQDRSFGVDAGCHDLRAVFSDGSEAEDYGIDLDDGDSFTWELID